MKILIFLLLSQLALAGTTSAELQISGSLQSEIIINVLPDADPVNNLKNIINSTALNQPVSLQTKINLEVQCIGDNTILNGQLQSLNNMNLIPRSNPALRIPYTVDVVPSSNNSSINTAAITRHSSGNTTSFGIPCNNKSTIIPFEVKSKNLPVNYPAGVYQDKLLFILTY